MIFKVFYQESQTEVPIRENTKALYIKGESERDIRNKLSKEPYNNYNIEYIVPIDGAFLEYEQQNEDYKVLEIW